MHLADETSMVEGPPCRVWSSAEAAVAGAEQRCAELVRWAGMRRSQGMSVCDRDFDDEILTLRPPRPCRRPLVLIGGMGPLAGLDGFMTACQVFGAQREIVLHQTCQVPDRGAAIMAGNPMLVTKLVDALTASVALSVNRATGRQAIDLLLLCNSAHAVMPALEASFPEMAARSRIWSLVDGAVDAVRRMGVVRPLVLSTRAARVARLYAAPLERAGLMMEEPDQDMQALLDAAIQDGVKAGDRHRAVTVAERLLRHIRERHAGIDALLAGCTEIPVLLRWLNEDRRERPLLRGHVRLLDPVALALEANRVALEPARPAETMRYAKRPPKVASDHN